MKLITLDFETYYAQDYSLSKLTTEEYVRDPRFEVIGVAVKSDDGPVEWASGTMAQLRRYLHEFAWGEAVLLAHNTAFDGFILGHHFGIYPAHYADTMSMARGLHPPSVPVSLASLAHMYGVGEKGDEVLRTLGKRREDFTDEELSRYGDYSVNDVELTYRLFLAMYRGGKGFPKKQLQVIDHTLRMYCDPVLRLNPDVLRARLDKVLADKQGALARAGVAPEELSSDAKFAEVLRGLGVEPPTKVSPRTGKTAYAFAKTDEAMVALAEHEDPAVQGVVAARLGVKSTLEETRIQRLLGVAARGPLPVPLGYAVAHTKRWQSMRGEALNLQNLPARGADAGHIKRAIEAPEGYVVVAADSGQIEARIVAWLAGQQELVSAFAKGEPIYERMAAEIYHKRVEDIGKGSTERAVGKEIVLAGGYGMGDVKFQARLKQKGIIVTDEEARRAIETYRARNRGIVELWRQGNRVLEALCTGATTTYGAPPGVVTVLPNGGGLRGPSGLVLQYPGLRRELDERQYWQYVYRGRRDGRVQDIKVWGGFITENLCQHIAWCVIGEQMLTIARRYRVVLTVHDEIVLIAREEEAEEAKAFVAQVMSTSPKWAPDLPLTCDCGYGRSYGDC